MIAMEMLLGMEITLVVIDIVCIVSIYLVACFWNMVYSLKAN